MRSCNTRAMGAPRQALRGWPVHRVPEHTQRFLVVPPRGMFAMLEQVASRKAHRTSAAFSEIEAGLSQINDPRQGARLVRALLRITDPMLRLAIVQMIENVGSAPADRVEITALNQPQLHEPGRQVGRPKFPKVRQVGTARRNAPLPCASARHRQSLEKPIEEIAQGRSPARIWLPAAPIDKHRARADRAGVKQPGPLPRSSRAWAETTASQNSLAKAPEVFLFLRSPLRTITRKSRTRRDSANRDG